ncbi:hypothetical protein [Sphaerisporangium sp. NPDC051011]|uniref:hypothetical protein n=1 Tax=Sphaerisporangium sp. NPDC051011 TaxID=3155792 RepID=UPI0033D41D38
MALALAGAMGSGTGAAAVAASAPTGPTASTPVVRAEPFRLEIRQPNAPRNLRLFQITKKLIKLKWDPPEDGYPPRPGVVAYDIYAGDPSFHLIATVPGNVLTYLDKRRCCDTVSYFVRARDAQGNESAASNIVTRDASECKKCHHHHHDEDGEEHGHDEDGKEHDDAVTNEPDAKHDDHADHVATVADRNHHDSDGDQEIIKADKLLHLENADDGGGGGDHSDHHGHVGHDGGHGGPGGGGAEAPAAGGHQPAGEKPAGGQHAGKQLPFTGAPVTALAGVGGALLVAGAAGVLISVRRRRSTGAR